MLGSEFTDKVTEYRILNEQLMSKALELLKTADDLMIKQESDNETEKPIYSMPRKETYKKKNFIDDFESNVIEFSKTFDDFNVNDDSKHQLSELDMESASENPIQNIAFDAFMSTKNKIKNKFTFPTDAPDNEEVFANSDSADNRNGLRIEELEDSDTNTMKKIVNQQNESDNMIKNLLNTKYTIQNNTKNLKIAKKLEDEPVEHPISKINNQCIKFLKQKIESLNEEIRSNNETIRKKTTDYDKVCKENQNLLEAKSKAIAQLNALKSQLIKKDEKITNLNAKIQATEMECRSMKNEQDNLLKASKDAAHDISNTEVKLSRAMKEIATLKESLSVHKQNEKDFKESFRKQLEEASVNVKIFEKKEKDFETAIKKQALLIENLKKQILYLTTQKNVNIAKKQLDSILNMDCK